MFLDTTRVVDKEQPRLYSSSHHQPTYPTNREEGKTMTEYQKELDAMLVRRDQIRADQLARYKNLTATRARTTTSNANVDKMQERIEWLRGEIKKQVAI